MTRGTPDYIEAVQRVKIDFFTEPWGMNWDIKGILHIGTNDGYEMQFYRGMGIENLAGVDPLPSAATAFRDKYPDIPHFDCALGEKSGVACLNITPGDGQGSSLLREVIIPDYKIASQLVPVIPGVWLPLEWSNFDCMVMDVQGMELQALKGFGERLKGFPMLSIECSIDPVYVGEAPASEVEAYLDSMGFERKTPLEVHNDVFFVRRDCV